MRAGGCVVLQSLLPRCELQLTPKGAKLRSLEGFLSFLDLTGVRRLSFDAASLAPGVIVASVAMPQKLLQVLYRGEGVGARDTIDGSEG